MTNANLNRLTENLVLVAALTVISSLGFSLQASDTASRPGCIVPRVG